MVGLAERVTSGGKGNSFPLGTLWGIVRMSLRLVPRENRKLGIHLALRAAPPGLHLGRGLSQVLEEGLKQRS